MTKRESEIKSELERMDALEKRITRTQGAARQFLVRAGIVTPKGNLRKVYR